MKNNFSISIIIPVYNVEKYISRCLDSLLNQTFKDFEIILINDGSKDKSLDILKKYEKEFNFIHVISQKNQGPAVARNEGLKYAKCKYIMFIDSDDYVDKDYVETFYKNINDTNYDIVMGGFKKTNGEKISFVRKLNDGIFSKYVVTGPVAKIYKNSFIKLNNLTFPDTNSSEDVIFSINAIYKNAKIKTIDYVGYYYFDNHFSISNTSHKGFNQNIKIIDLLDSINLDDIKNKELNDYYIIRYCIWYLLYSGKTATSKEFIYEYKKLFTWLEKNIDKYSKNKYLKKCPSGEIKSIHKYIFIFMLIHKFKLVHLFSKLYCGGINEK